MAPAPAFRAAGPSAPVDALFLPTTTGWAEALHARLAYRGVAAVAAHTLVQMGQDTAKAPARFLVQGPIVIGAYTRLGAGHWRTIQAPAAGCWWIKRRARSPGLCWRTARRWPPAPSARSRMTRSGSMSARSCAPPADA